MSFKVLVIPEDHTYNGAILKPLVEAVVADAGKVAAKVKVLEDPRMQGFDQAVTAIRGVALERYAWMDLWLFMPDADRAVAAAMTSLEEGARARGIKLLCCAAQPELEIYASAPYRTEIPGGWPQARRHARFKEIIFPPLLERHGDPRRPAGGRDLMINEAVSNLGLLFQLCPELKELRDRVAEHLAGPAT